jgi:hypothetical protein
LDFSIDAMRREHTMADDTMKTVSKSLVGAVLALGLSAHAGASVTDTWDFSDHPFSVTSTATDGGGAAVAGMNVRISGWYDDGTGIDSADNVTLWYGSGLGVDSGGWTEDRSPNHAMDNSGPNEFLAFEFDEAVSLQAFRFGWWSNDSDATVLYKSSGSGTSDLDNDRISDFNTTSSAYQLLTNRLDSRTNTQNVSNATPQPVFSKVWLIGAYMGNVHGNSNSYEGAADYVKLASITTLRQHTPPPGGEVPAPMTLFLMAFGLLPLARRYGKGVAVDPTL